MEILGIVLVCVGIVAIIGGAGTGIGIGIKKGHFDKKTGQYVTNNTHFGRWLVSTGKVFELELVYKTDSEKKQMTSDEVEKATATYNKKYQELRKEFINSNANTKAYKKAMKKMAQNRAMHGSLKGIDTYD